MTLPYPTPTQYPVPSSQGRMGSAGLSLRLTCVRVRACARKLTSGLGKWEREGGMGDDDDDDGEKTRLGVCDRKEYGELPRQGRES